MLNNFGAVDVRKVRMLKSDQLLPIFCLFFFFIQNIIYVNINPNISPNLPHTL